MSEQSSAGTQHSYSGRYRGPMLVATRSRCPHGDLSAPHLGANPRALASVRFDSCRGCSGEDDLRQGVVKVTKHQS